MKHTIGIIAEDESDVNSARVLIHRIANNDKIKVKPKHAKGCGRLRRKCNAWAKDLHIRGCSLLIVIHDLDRRELPALRREITDALLPCPIARHLICIPIEELEAWLLSDPHAIMKALKLKSLPNISGYPEKIKSPKEVLEEKVFIASKKETYYIHTKHNEVISMHLSLKVARQKCPSFIPFYDFIKTHCAN